MDVVYDGLPDLLHFAVRHGLGIALLLDRFLAAMFQLLGDD